MNSNMELQLKICYMPHTYISIYYSSNTGSNKNMETHLTNQFLRATKMVLHLHRKYIWGESIMMEIQGVQILGSYRTMKL